MASIPRMFPDTPFGTIPQCPPTTPPARLQWRLVHPIVARRSSSLMLATRRPTSPTTKYKQTKNRGCSVSWWEGGAMNPMEVPALTAEQLDAVATLDRTTPNVRRRTRAQMVLLTVERHLGVREIAVMVRECEGTVRCWLKRSSAHGSDGLQDAWAGGAPTQVTPAYQAQVLLIVRRRPRSLELP